MTTKALDTWKNAKPEDQDFLLCELGICSEWVQDDNISGFTKTDNKRCSLVVKAARTVLKQIANGSLYVAEMPTAWRVKGHVRMPTKKAATSKTSKTPKTSKTSKKGAKK